MHYTHPLMLVPLAALLSLGHFACSSNGDVQDDEELSNQPGMTTEEDEDGYIVENLDTRGDGESDIIRYFEEYQDPRDEERTRRRIRKMEIDVNGDGKINVRRHYDDYGNVNIEENDHDLDGVMDSTLYFIGGELARKEFHGVHDERGDYIKERRIYLDGQLVRVERDHNADGDPNRWEYYEDGVLMRIGRDTTGDGSADTWQLR